MGGPNARYGLPPEDREDLPALFEDRAPEAPIDEPLAPALLVPELDGAIASLGALLDDGVLALGEMKMARSRRDWPAFEKAAWDLATALMSDPRGQALRLRKTVSQARREAAREALAEKERTA